MSEVLTTEWYDKIKLIDLVQNRWRVNPVLLWVAISTFLLSVFGVIALILGYFQSVGTTIGFVEDYSIIVNFVLGVPGIITLYVLFPKQLRTCFTNLLKNDVFGAPSNGIIGKYPEYDVEQYLENVRDAVFNKWWVIAAFVLSSLFLVVAIPTHLTYNNWVAKNLVVLALTELVWLCSFTITVTLGFRILVSVWWINQAFKRFNVNIRPLFPDGAGGLVPLSQYTLTLGYILFFFGLQLSMNQIAFGYVSTGQLGTILFEIDTIIPWIAYLLLAPVIFFAPISAAHDAMGDAKAEELLVISRSFDEEYKSLRKKLGQLAITKDELRDQSGKINQLQKLYKLVDSFPVWPFQLERFAQFFATVLSPLVLTILSGIATSWLTDWLT